MNQNAALVVPAYMNTFFRWTAATALPLLLGIAWMIFIFPFDLTYGVRRTALGISNPWIAVILFYCIPIVCAYLPSLFISRIEILGLRIGWWFILGCFLCAMWLTAMGWDDYFYCRGFGGCGTGNYRWFLSTALLPTVIGCGLALRAK